MKYLVILSLLVVTSCKSVGIIESSDPKDKIGDGYRMLQTGRSLPAKRLFIDANEIAQKSTDESLVATSFVALGDMYKFKDVGAQTERTYDFNKSITSYEEASKILNKLKYNQRLSMAYWGMAQAYTQENNVDKSCEYINKAARAYYEPSGGDQDKLDQKVISSVLPYFEYSKSQKYNAKCGVKDIKK